MFRYLYGQDLGARQWSWGGTNYDKVLVENPVPANLETWSVGQSGLDFKESAAFTNTEKAKVIDAEKFVLVWPHELSRPVVGVEVSAMCSLRADGSHKTYLDEVVARLKRVDKDGNAALVTTLNYDFDTSPEYTADGWSDMVGVKMNENLDYWELPRDETLVLEVDVYAHTVADATNQKVRLHHARGSSELVVVLVEEQRRR